MSPELPALVTIDVGGTLGTTDRPGVASALVAASPLDQQEAVRVVREVLHTASAIDDELIAELCGALAIPETAFPRSVPAAPLRLFAGTPAALQEISSYLPVVTLSNVSCVEADPDRLAQMLAPWVAGHFPSCIIGFAKPDRRAFEAVADHWGISTGRIVHIGDHWECDVLGAIGAGAHAVWVSGGRAIPRAHTLVGSHVRVASDLADAARHVRDLCARRR